MFSLQKCLRKGLVAAVVLGSLSCASANAERMAMETSAAGSVLGIIPQTMATHWAQGGVDVQLSLNQTLTKSLLKIAKGSLDSAVVPPLAFNALQKGAGPYAQLGEAAIEASENVRALFGMPGSLFHSIVWADSGIKTWSDAAGKRIFIGPPAGAANTQITTMIAAGGLPEADYEPIKAPWGAASQGFQDGQFDVFVGVYGLGSQALSELSLSRDIRLLSVAGDHQEPPTGLGLQVAEIAPNTYPGQVNEDPVLTWQTVMMMAVHKDLSEETAYLLTKIYMEKRAEVAKSNALLAQLPTTDAFAGVNAPLHPGALRYYREAGVAVPEALLPQ